MFLGGSRCGQPTPNASTVVGQRKSITFSEAFTSKKELFVIN